MEDLSDCSPNQSPFADEQTEAWRDWSTRPKSTEPESGRAGVGTRKPCLRHQSHVRDVFCSDRLSLLGHGGGV